MESDNKKAKPKVKIDITGQRFGNWIVLEELGGGKVKCQCQCENKTEKILYKKAVREGKTKSCGCLRSSNVYNRIHKNMVGQQFGHWVVIEEIGRGKVLCRCSCGTVKEVYKQALKEGKSKSCGCIENRKEAVFPGQQFGEWTVIRQLHGSVEHKCLCRCSCGKTAELYIKNLKTGTSKSCGHIRENKENITGQQFGEWKVLERVGSGKYKCRCSCGNVKTVYRKLLVSGQSKSCGCRRSENIFITYKNKNKELIGKQFGEWTVIDYAGNRKMKCKCSCGTVKEVYKQALLQHVTLSCGCKQLKHSLITNLKIHGDITGARHNSPRQLWQIQTLYNRDMFIQLIDEYESKPTIAQLALKLDITEAHTLRVVHKFELEDYVDIRPASSRYENEIVEYIKLIDKHNYKILTNTRSVIEPYELDIYIPEKKLAIEFNGDYWHSAVKRDKYYHQQKTLACNKKDIRLIHIFEHEWLDKDKQNKIKNILYDIICGTKNIYARNTLVELASIQEVKQFENEYHLQGYAPSKVNIKIVFNNEIIGLMTFGKPRFTKDYEYELIRLCYKSGVSVIGGSEKMVKYFIRRYKPQSIISYCDIAKFTGSTYTKMGFTTSEDMITEPNYIWINISKKDVLSRYQTQKHKLLEKGLGTPDQTEDEIMSNLGYLKIYDSGNLKFCWLNN